MDLVTLCPGCNEECEHTLLREGPSNLTVQCDECQKVHTFSPPRARLTELALVISHGDKSWTSRLETLLDEDIAVGFEFEHEGHRMLVTGMEGRDGRHHQKLGAREVKVLHAKMFDTATLKISVNERDVTKSYAIEMDPDAEINIGQVIEVADKKFKVKTLKSDQNRTLNRGFLYVRNIRRAFCDEVPHWVKVGKILDVRKRGKPPGARSAPRHGRANP